MDKKEPELDLESEYLWETDYPDQVCPKCGSTESYHYIESEDEYQCSHCSYHSPDPADG